MKSSWPVHWTCWQPTPYNQFFFEAISCDSAVDLTVHFREQQLASHPWASDFSRMFRSRVFERTAGIDWRLLRLGARSSALFVVAGWNDPSSIVLLNVLMARRHPFAVWTDTPDLGAQRSPVKQMLRSAWLQRVFRLASAVLGTGTPALAALSLMGCPPAKLRNLPYSVDLNSFNPRTVSRLREPLVFLSCGRLHQDKGFDLALSALARVYGGANRPFVYRIAGVGPERSRLSALAVELGVAGSVEFLDWVEPSDLPALYRQSDVLLHPARREPYGVTVLEAMASGVAVIGSDATAAVIDRIVHGVNGFSHPSGDSSAMAGIIATIVQDPTSLDAVKREARRTAEEWPVSRAVDIVKDLCSSALGRLN